MKHIRGNSTLNGCWSPPSPASMTREAEARQPMSATWEGRGPGWVRSAASPGSAPRTCWPANTHVSLPTDPSYHFLLIITPLYTCSSRPLLFPWGQLHRPLLTPTSPLLILSRLFLNSLTHSQHVSMTSHRWVPNPPSPGIQPSWHLPQAPDDKT